MDRRCHDLLAGYSAVIAVLERFASTPMGAFGRLLVGDRAYYTVERPWLENAVRKSSVPLGDYDLLWLPTTTPVPEEFGGHTWYLSGGTVSADHLSYCERTRIALHIANTSDEVEGCIGIGQHLTCHAGRWAVAKSRAAMLDLYASLPRDGARLSIVAGQLG